MKNTINDIGINNCTSCGACAVICPTNAIDIKIDSDGFYRPFINDNCIECGKCKTVCYKYADFNSKDELFRNDLVIYSGQHKDKNILMKSSSGGIASAITTWGIDNGYKILGAIYDYELNIVKHIVASSHQEADELRGSKYLQSYTVDAFKQLTDKCIVFGTSCQIYGLKEYAKQQNYKDIIYIDLLCHGVPSYLLWEQYIKYIQKKFSIGKITNVFFRSKRLCWHKYSMEIIGTTGKYSRSSTDIFKRLYGIGFTSNKSCYDCKFRKDVFCSDIKIGDFWGPKFLNNKDGISLIVANKKGQEILTNINNSFELNRETISDLKNSYVEPKAK
jgi:coenzyme F420-reducing hydrogenase beta subunit